MCGVNEKRRVIESTQSGDRLAKVAEHGKAGSVVFSIEAKIKTENAPMYFVLVFNQPSCNALRSRRRVSEFVAFLLAEWLILNCLLRRSMS